MAKIHSTIHQPALPTQLLYSKMNLKPSGAQPASQPSGRTVIGGDQNGLDQRERSISTSGAPASILPPVSTGKYLVEYFLSEIRLNTEIKNASEDLRTSRSHETNGQAHLRRVPALAREFVYHNHCVSFVVNLPNKDK